MSNDANTKFDNQSTNAGGKTSQTWQAIYDTGEVLGQGGQGIAWQARKKDSTDQTWPFVLKVLKSPRSYRSRSRLHQEILSLRKLSEEKHYHQSVVRLVADNAEDYADSRKKLYLITEFIEGKSLDLIVPVSIDRALEIVLSLLDALSYCHDLGVIHRDIKPQNIKLRSDGIPVLLDFGLSYDQERMSNHTGKTELLGNKFLALPELCIKGNTIDDKRDQRSDICMCVGILFYLLTGIEPNQLLDQHSQLPHQRADGRESLLKVASKKIVPLRQLFDKGFSNQSDKRFQSIQALIDEIEHIQVYDNELGETESLPEILKKARQVAESSDLELKRKILDTAREAVDNAHLQMAKLYTNDFSATDLETVIDMKDQYMRVVRGFKYKYLEGAEFKTWFIGNFVGNEIVISARTEDNQIEELHRAVYKNFNINDQVHIPICRHFEERMKNVVQLAIFV